MKTTYETICKALQGIAADSTNSADLIVAVMQIEGTSIIRARWNDDERAGTQWTSKEGQSWIRASEDTDTRGNSLTIRLHLEYYE